ncbi:phage resistance protein [Dactylosporangium sp. NPDC048998]|uniref:phage resistance protein n=1 Tax=Dactylosporangium sp. NPDC048998 TaxID=3363976 RepID=UPI00372120A6
MTLLRDLIDIPTSVGDADFVVRASEGADLRRYVVTDDLRRNFDEALSMVGHAITSGRSQAKFLHGSFGSGKSHFMAVLREILQHNPEARAVRGLAEPVAKADEAWLRGKKILNLTFHMLDAQSVEQAVLEGYLRQVTALHPEAPAPAVHLSAALLADAARLREDLGDERFFARLGGSGLTPGTGGGSLSAQVAQKAGWTAKTYGAAAAQPPGTAERDQLVSALTATFFTGAVRSGRYLDLDTGLAVITRHAKDLGYDGMVFFLDEMILWLSTKIADHTFVQTEGAKLNKLVESSDAARPLPIASFVARQRNLEEFLGPQVGGTEREALAHVMRSVQGRLGSDIVLADTNLPEITEKRLLKPKDEAARHTIDQAFAAVRGNRDVWDTLLLGAQYGDAGIGSDAAAFRSLYPFSPALVATLVALSQALQRQRTALKVMTELLAARRDTLQVNDLIGVSALFDPLVLHGELPDRPQLKQLFQAARETYLHKLRPLMRAAHGIEEEQTAGHELFLLDDRLIKTLMLGALVQEVPALHNLTAAKLHALNFGSIASPIPGYENQIVLDRLRRLNNDAGELHLTEGPDPVVSIKLSSVDYDKLLDLVRENETASGVLQQMVRELVGEEFGLASAEGTLGELQHPRDWRGRRHYVQVRFGNVRDKDTLPESALIASGETWRLVIDYPFDPGHRRNEDFARIETLPRGSRTVFWMPLFLTDEVMGRVRQLAKVNYLLGNTGSGDRLQTLAADWSLADRQQGKIYLQQRQQQLRAALLNTLKQAYGAAKPQPSDVEDDSIGVLHTLADGLHIGDPRGGTLKAAFENLTGELLAWAYPGRPALPDDEKPVTRSELGKVLKYAKLASADPTKGAAVEQLDRKTIQRVCNQLRLGELIDHRYVLTTSTCWWSQHLLQGAAQQGYKDHFPVHVLRDLLDKPDARGFDRELQNLIIAVFALDQQLAWYQGNVKVMVDAVQVNIDQYELRHPPMPGEDDWTRAVERGGALFGEPLPKWRSPANLGELAGTLRRAAQQHTKTAADLVTELHTRASALGLDEHATAGRLATARRVARLLTGLAAEQDDVALVESVAHADVGDIDDRTASAAFVQARPVLAELRSTQWQLLDAIRTAAVTNPDTQAVIDDLRIAANHEQLAADLVPALRTAAGRSAALLAKVSKPVGPIVVDPLPNPGGKNPGGTPAATSRIVTGTGELAEVEREIRSAVEGGSRVRITWEVL